MLSKQSCDLKLTAIVIWLIRKIIKFPRRTKLTREFRCYIVLS